jgi:hypothetical protein
MLTILTGLLVIGVLSLPTAPSFASLTDWGSSRLRPAACACS